jgi:beta-lactamase class A
MADECGRRAVLYGAAATLATACVRRAGLSSPAPVRTASAFAQIEASVGGRVGVFAIDTGSGEQLAHRADERFALCSTFKWVLVSAVLARVDRGQLSMVERVPYGASDLLDYAPTTRAHVSDGFMTVEALAKAAITNSDNTAANLLLRKVGGPSGVTGFARQLGDAVTRLDRDEPTLNENAPGDVRDTTTPRAIANLMRSVLWGDVLSPAGRDRIVGWLVECETGAERLRAGIPRGWTVGDKTGTGLRGAVNDVAFVIPPGRAPIVISAYMSDGVSSVATLNNAHAEVARLVVRLVSPDVLSTEPRRD